MPKISTSWPNSALEENCLTKLLKRRYNIFEELIIKTFSERKAAETMKQVLRAVLYCHENNIVHRDLKPENVLYETSKAGSVLKVVDFGTSRSFEANKKMSQKIGTPYYIAPEVLLNNYDEKCDIWSCGVILFIMLCGCRLCNNYRPSTSI